MWAAVGCGCGGRPAVADAGVVTFALGPASHRYDTTGSPFPAIYDQQRACYAALLADPDPLLAESLRLFRTMLSGRLDDVPGSYLVSNRPLDAQVARSATFDQGAG